MIQDIVASGASNFSLLSAEEGVEQARRFTPHSATSFADQLTHPGFLDVEVDYVLCTLDKTLTPEFQRKTIKQIEDAGATVGVHEMKTDHCWCASTPRSMAKLVLEIVGVEIV